MLNSNFFIEPINSFETSGKIYPFNQHQSQKTWNVLLEIFRENSLFVILFKYGFSQSRKEISELLATNVYVQDYTIIDRFRLKSTHLKTTLHEDLYH